MSLNLNQTLQSKYPHLEISVLNLSEVKKNNDNFRIDSEPFKKSNLTVNTSIDYVKLSEISIINPSKTELSKLNLDTEVSFISMQNLGNGNINDREIGTIKDYKTGYTYFAEDDILIAKITPCMEHGKCGIATNLKNKIGFGSTEYNVFRITDERFIKEFVFCFLNRENIRKIAADNMIGTSGRQRVPTNFYENLLIPLFPLSFQQEIETLVKTSHEHLEESKALYQHAEALLYAELGLNPHNPLDFIARHSERSDSVAKNLNISTETKDSSPTAQNDDNKYAHLNISVRTLKQSFLATGRLDSEYYQNKYDLMEEKIKKNGFKTLEEICSLINYGSVPTSPYSENGEGVPYIKGLNLKNLQVNEDKLDRITNTEDLNDRFFTKENDIVISQMGTVGDVGVVSKEQENYIFASFTIRVRLKNIKEFNPLFVGLYIQNIAKEWYLYRNIAQASVRQNTDLPTIKNLYVPTIPYEKQTQIADLLKQSFLLRKLSSELLETAKQKVETAIEQG